MGNFCGKTREEPIRNSCEKSDAENLYSGQKTRALLKSSNTREVYLANQSEILFLIKPFEKSTLQWQSWVPSMETVDNNVEKNLNPLKARLFLQILRPILKSSIRTFFFNWCSQRHLKEAHLDIENSEDIDILPLILAKSSSSIYENYSIEAENLLQMDSIDFESATQLIQDKNKILIEKNALALYSNNNTMEITRIFTFFEEMFDKKYEADEKNLKNNRPLISIPEYFTQYIKGSYGLKSIFNDHISLMISTIQKLSDQKSKYGKLICKLLQIHDPEPVPDQLAWFLTKARHEFKKEIMIKQQIKSARRPDELHVVEAMHLLHSLFETDKFSRAKAIVFLQPATMTAEDFLAFRIGFRILKMGWKAENFFQYFDKEGKGWIKKEEFYKELVNVVEISLTLQDIDILNSQLDPNGLDIITHAQFISKISTKFYIEKKSDPSLVVTKTHFLEILIEVYNVIQVKYTAFITHFFQKFKNDYINKDGFSEVVNALDSRINAEVIDQYYNAYSTFDGICLSSVITCAFQNILPKKALRDFRNIYIEVKRLESDSPEDKKSYRKSMELDTTAPVKYQRRGSECDQVSLNSVNQSFQRHLHLNPSRNTLPPKPKDNLFEKDQTITRHGTMKRLSQFLTIPK